MHIKMLERKQEDTYQPLTKAIILDKSSLATSEGCLPDTGVLYAGALLRI